MAQIDHLFGDIHKYLLDSLSYCLPRLFSIALERWQNLNGSIGRVNFVGSKAGRATKSLFCSFFFFFD